MVFFADRSTARRVLAACSVIMVAVACGGDERPSAAEWTPVWDAKRALVPTAAEVVAGGQELCGELVGTYRSEFDALRPTPSESLDGAVEEWTLQVENLVFDCPHDDPDDLAERFERVESLTEGVDAGLRSLDG